MSTFAIAVLVFLVAGWIGYPLFRGYSSGDFALAEPLARSRSDEKEAIMNTLGEIEFDFHMNKLSAEDYQNLKNNYASAAVEILKTNKARPKLNKERNLKNVRASIEQEIEDDLRKL